MFYLKRAMMTGILNRKKKRQPFDEVYAENYSFGTDGDGTSNNSYYFSAHSASQNRSLYVRLGLRDNGNAEVWVFYDNGSVQYSMDEMIFTHDTTPLKVANTNGRWSFTYNGKLTASSGEVVDCAMDCKFTAKGRIVDFFAHMPSKRTATALAQDKWTKNYFAGVSENNSVHYEQEGELDCDVTLNGERFTTTLPCLRDHSFGRRVWGYMNNHLWLAAVDGECQLNFSMVSYPSMSVLEVGHVRLGDNPVSFVTKAHYNRHDIVTGSVPSALDVTLTLDNGKTVEVKAKLLNAKTYVFENGDYALTEGIAELNINGVTCRGILEVGFNRDSTRFMNGKNIDKIKE